MMTDYVKFCGCQTSWQVLCTTNISHEDFYSLGPPTIENFEYKRFCWKSVRSLFFPFCYHDYVFNRRSYRLNLDITMSRFR